LADQPAATTKSTSSQTEADRREDPPGDQEALWRIEKGTYGICRDCGEEIAAPRLNAIPWTRVCSTCKEKQNA
jgi:RNA polymerase-binding transcription factor DksA